MYGTALVRLVSFFLDFDLTMKWQTNVEWVCSIFAPPDIMANNQEGQRTKSASLE